MTAKAEYLYAHKQLESVVMEVFMWLIEFRLLRIYRALVLEGLRDITSNSV